MAVLFSNISLQPKCTTKPVIIVAVLLLLFGFTHNAQEKKKQNKKKKRKKRKSPQFEKHLKMLLIIRWMCENNISSTNWWFMPAMCSHDVMWFSSRACVWLTAIRAARNHARATWENRYAECWNWNGSDSFSRWHYQHTMTTTKQANKKYTQQQQQNYNRKCRLSHDLP